MKWCFRGNLFRLFAPDDGDAAYERLERYPFALHAGEDLVDEREAQHPSYEGWVASYIISQLGDGGEAACLQEFEPAVPPRKGNRESPWRRGFRRELSLSNSLKHDLLTSRPALKSHWDVDRDVAGLQRDARLPGRQ